MSNITLAPTGTDTKPETPMERHVRLLREAAEAAHAAAHLAYLSRFAAL